jgi:hypothetical protein
MLSLALKTRALSTLLNRVALTHLRTAAIIHFIQLPTPTSPFDCRYYLYTSPLLRVVFHLALNYFQATAHLDFISVLQFWAICA